MIFFSEELIDIGMLVLQVEKKSNGHIKVAEKTHDIHEQGIAHF